MFRSRRTHRRSLLWPGRVFILVALIVLLAAWNSGANLFYLVFAAVGSFVVLSLVASWLAMRKVELRCEAPYAVHRNTLFNIMVRIENHRTVLPLLSVRLESERNLGASLGYIISIPARQAALLSVPLSFERRGVYRLPAMDLITTFPFGLLEIRRRYTSDVEVVVYPRVLPARTSMLNQVRGSGEIPRLTQGEGDEFHSLREYMPGDDLRFIAWRISARHDQLLVKEMEQQASKYVVFIFDTRYRPEVADFEDVFEEAIELIASLATTLIKRQYIVNVVTPEVFFAEGEGQAHALKLLDMLARIEPIKDIAHVRPNWDSLTGMGNVTALHVSTDPADWGQRRPGEVSRVLDPKDIIHV